MSRFLESVLGCTDLRRRGISEQWGSEVLSLAHALTTIQRHISCTFKTEHEYTEWGSVCRKQVGPQACCIHFIFNHWILENNHKFVALQNKEWLFPVSNGWCGSHVLAWKTSTYSASCMRGTNSQLNKGGGGEWTVLRLAILFVFSWLALCLSLLSKNW
jgi:hypothetical protein